MNVLFLSLLYHPEAVDAVSALSHVGLQNQASGFQWAMIEGLRNNMRAGETLSILNALPVGTYPRQYGKLRLPGKTYGNLFTEIGCLNVPFCKQKQRERAARWAIERWMEQSSQNRRIVLYSLYLPYLRAAAQVRKLREDLKVCVIVPDLPGSLGLSSGRRGLLKTVEYRRGEQSLRLASQMNGFILLTEQMARPLHAEHQKHCVIEGLIAAQSEMPEAVELPADDRPAVLYTGTLNRELGIDHLLSAFAQIDTLQLWLCGRGDMEAAVRDAQKTHGNIRYFGFVSKGQINALQSKAAMLINPRTNRGEYTKYSFPSKTLEYMRSGKPVLCCRLDGIPAEYDEYLTYIEPQNAQGIQSAVLATAALPQKERDAIGSRAKEFVQTRKNNIMQGKKAVDLLRKL